MSTQPDIHSVLESYTDLLLQIKGSHDRLQRNLKKNRTSAEQFGIDPILAVLKESVPEELSTFFGTYFSFEQTNGKLTRHFDSERRVNLYSLIQSRITDGNMEWAFTGVALTKKELLACGFDSSDAFYHALGTIKKDWETIFSISPVTVSDGGVHFHISASFLVSTSLRWR